MSLGVDMRVRGSVFVLAFVRTTAGLDFVVGRYLRNVRAKPRYFR